MARLFFALELTEPVRRQLEALRPQPGPGLKPVPAEQWHITLHFLADADPESIRFAVADLDLPPFELPMGGPGVFRTRDGGNILWVGFDRHPGLLEWHGRLGHAIGSLGLPVEKRPFHPHATLARASAGYPRRLLTRFLEQTTEPIATNLSVTHCALFSSVLSPKGPQYQVVDRFPGLRPPGA